jgi:hypothetical protein
MELFSQKNIIHGPRVSLKRCHYQGHCLILPDAATAIDASIAAIDYIGKKYDSEDCIPFAVLILKFNEDNISLAEDNGEIGCGQVLASCLTDVQDTPVSCMVCVTRYIEGAFVADMYQGQKHRVVREAASKAVRLLIESIGNKADTSLNSAIEGESAVKINEAQGSPKRPLQYTPENDSSMSIQITTKVKQLTFDISKPTDESIKLMNLDSSRPKSKPFK